MVVNRIPLRKPRKPLRDEIRACLTEWLTTQYPQQSKPTTSYEPKLADCLQGILRARRIKPATRSFEGGDHDHIRSNCESTRSTRAINKVIRDVVSCRGGMNVALIHGQAIRSEDLPLVGSGRDAGRFSAPTTRSCFVVWTSIKPSRPYYQTLPDAVETILE